MSEPTERERVACLVYGLPVLEGALAPTLAPSQGTSPLLRFVTATDVKMIVLVEKRSNIADTGDVAIGVGSVHGRILSLITLLGTPHPAMNEPLSPGALLCETDGGQPFLLDGGAVRGVGMFPRIDEATILFEGERVGRLDTTAFYRAIEQRVWERSALVGAHGARIVRAEKESDRA